MIRKSMRARLGIAVLLGFASLATAQDQAKTKADSKEETPTEKATEKVETAGKLEKATFGGGCFWCSEAVFERIPGVKSVVSGFAGGSVPNPSYEMVCTGLTGHAEVVQIEFDPSVVSYDKLLTVFWKSHDPTTLNQQGDDFGTQYRSIILYSNDSQRKAAEKSYQELKERRAFRRPIVTELVPLKAFYPAEAYHQDYYRNHRGNQYSDAYIAPKLRKLKLRP